MADKNRIDHDPENLENLSPEELQKRIEEDKKNAKRSLRSVSYTHLTLPTNSLV